ncbi:hypothetical protein GCM10009801_43980 [Streptomyces albiaxialis]|uniref:Uncharacterized protein n=1 Tax=Streptomyces albiaxialis TaxID=329523 RepID=A0ABN2W4H3_9ACTN
MAEEELPGVAAAREPGDRAGGPGGRGAAHSCGKVTFMPHPARGHRALLHGPGGPEQAHATDGTCSVAKPHEATGACRRLLAARARRLGGV